MDKIKKFFQGIYNQIVTMHDSPHHVALGFGMGVFLGILPFTGTLAAITMAVIFKFNKASALLGSVVTNTWLSVVTFAIAGKIGCALLGYDWKIIYDQAHDVVFHFTWASLWKTASIKIILPLFLGYLIVGALSGLFSYWVIRIVLRRRTQV